MPTLSLLLGLPIPFANLGAVVPELFTSLPLDTSATKEGWFTSLPLGTSGLKDSDTSETKESGVASPAPSRSKMKDGLTSGFACFPLAASEKKDSETGEEGLSLPALQSLCHSLYINARQVPPFLHSVTQGVIILSDRNTWPSFS